MLIKFFKHVLMVVMLVGITPFVYAEDAAPVYDADSLPPQFDGQPDTGAVSSSAAAPEPLTLEQRMGRLEQQLTNVQQHSSASSKTDQLQTEVQTLRGQVEELTHQVQVLQNQQRSMFTDLDKRLSKQLAAPKAVKPTPPPAASDNVDDSAALKPAKPKPDTPSASSKSDATQPDVAEEQQTYQTAYDLIKVKKYDDAIAALQGMLKKYPSGQFAANAHYWLGELYGLTGKNDQSATEFSTIIDHFPDSAKVSDAQFKLGLIYVAEQKWSDAKSAFKKVTKKYPGTASAHLASEQLKELKQAGH